MVAVLCLAQQSEVAVCHLEQISGRRRSRFAHGLADSAASGAAVPWLDDMADEINAAINRLQDGFLGVESGIEPFRKEGSNLGMRGVEPLR